MLSFSFWFWFVLQEILVSCIFDSPPWSCRVSVIVTIGTALSVRLRLNNDAFSFLFPISRLFLLCFRSLLLRFCFRFRYMVLRFCVRFQCCCFCFRFRFVFARFCVRFWLTVSVSVFLFACSVTSWTISSIDAFHIVWVFWFALSRYLFLSFFLLFLSPLLHCLVAWYTQKDTFQ